MVERNYGAKRSNDLMHQQRLEEKLDKIIQLLELRNSIYQAQYELKAGEYIPIQCTCHKKGQTSAVEICPIHG